MTDTITAEQFADAVQRMRHVTLNQRSEMWLVLHPAEVFRAPPGVLHNPNLHVYVSGRLDWMVPLQEWLGNC